MPRFDLPSKQADSTPNWVQVADPRATCWLGRPLFAMHRAVKIVSRGSRDAPLAPRDGRRQR